MWLEAILPLVIPGRCEASNPESRDSGSGADAPARNDSNPREPMTSDRLFVYGTLMRGFDHPMARLLSANADFLGGATCRGALHLVKHYPGLILSEAASDVVHGELFRLRAADDLLREFDVYEA